MLVSHRNRIEDGELVLSILESPNDFECCKSLDCGDRDLNDFFRSDALPHRDQLLATTYCLRIKKAMGEKDSPPVAFITFSNDTIRTTKTKNFQLFKRYLSQAIPIEKHYPFLPAVKIGRLAVDKKYQGHNFGTYLLNLTKRLFLTGNRTGCRFITVDAYRSNNVLKFYKKNNFQFLHDGDSGKKTRIMFFDLLRVRM